jgi:hypothetical protein
VRGGGISSRAPDAGGEEPHIFSSAWSRLPCRGLLCEYLTMSQRYLLPAMVDSTLRAARGSSGAGQLRNAQDPQGIRRFARHQRYRLHFTPTGGEKDPARLVEKRIPS